MTYRIWILLFAMLPFVGCWCQSSIDTVELWATVTAPRTVALSWHGTGWGEATAVFRRWPGETDWVQIGQTLDSEYVDVHSRQVCSDTVDYYISQQSAGTRYVGFASAYVDDNEPTSPATWGVVTVDTARNAVVLRWEPSGDADIMGYMICEGSPSMVVDSVFGRENCSYLFPDGSSADIGSFRICAFDSCRRASALTEVCNNMVLILDADSCSREVMASWNSYQNMPGGVDCYEVWASEDGAPWYLAGRCSGEDCEGIGFAAMRETERVEVFVRALGGGLESFSNKALFSFSSEPRPSTLHIRKVSVSDDGTVVTVVGQTDAAFEGGKFAVFRSVDGGLESLAGYLMPSEDGRLIWRDEGVDALRLRYGYRFALIDRCGRGVMKTDMACTVLLNIEEQAGEVMAMWNGYDGWSGNTLYRLLGSCDGGDENGWIQLYEGANCETGAIERGRAYGSFKVVAAEGTNSAFIHCDTLQSGVVRYSPEREVWLPNAFTPCENSNNLFCPYSDFFNEKDYSFEIYNRMGVLVFSSQDTAACWDGCMNGVLQPQGAYVYIVRWKGEGDVFKIKRGTVTVIY